jgi:hypothetical protein
LAQPRGILLAARTVVEAFGSRRRAGLGMTEIKRHEPGCLPVSFRALWGRPGLLPELFFLTLRVIWFHEASIGAFMKNL